MLIRVLFLILIFASPSAFSAQCLVSEALKDAKLASNAQFWDEYGQLASKGNVSDAQMKALMEKYGAGSGNKAAAAEVKQSLNLSVQSKAEKEIKGLQPNLKSKVDEFLDTALKPGGLKEIRENPGRWHFEKLKGMDAYTVRLNDSYRVLFQVEGDSLKVLRVNRDQIHGI